MKKKNNNIFFYLRLHSLLFLLIPMIMSACSNDDDLPPYIEPIDQEEVLTSKFENTPIYQRHKDTPLKILAIGNSFTENATTFMPWMAEMINEDSICITKLMHSGCSLSQHWEYHVNNSPEYKLYYSDNGSWFLSEITTIDDALALFNWDIIVIQQASGLSGYYKTYQPYLDNLVRLFRETNPNAKIAWHYTWPYREGTQNDYFADYDNDPLKMYEAILNAGNRASENLDLSIPAATLIWEMRKQYPEVENLFSTDGYHISSNLALYALSTLWYECLVTPFTGTTSINPTEYPESIDPKQFQRAKNIILSLMGYDKDPGNPDSVPMLSE